MHFSKKLKTKKLHANRVFPSAMVGGFHYVDRLSLGVSVPLSIRLATEYKMSTLMAVHIVVLLVTLFL